jgi:predicted ATP-grasp superfamily ATP-dependent carboligase
MDFDLDMEDFTIIQNALHYYKKVEKRGNFRQYDTERINALRDKLAEQISPSTIKSTVFSYSSTADTAETYRLKKIKEDENISFRYE